MASSNVPEELLKKIDGQDRHVNAKTICCKICPSIILLPEKGRLISKPVKSIVHYFQEHCLFFVTSPGPIGGISAIKLFGSGLE